MRCRKEVNIIALVINSAYVSIFFQVMFWSQQISFWLIGIMVVTSIRGLLITLTKVMSFLYSLANSLRVSEKVVSGVVLSYSLVYTIQAQACETFSMIICIFLAKKFSKHVQSTPMVIRCARSKMYHFKCSSIQKKFS